MHVTFRSALCVATSASSHARAQAADPRVSSLDLLPAAIPRKRASRSRRSGRRGKEEGVLQKI